MLFSYLITRQIGCVTFGTPCTSGFTINYILTLGIHSELFNIELIYFFEFPFGIKTIFLLYQDVFCILLFMPIC